MFLFATAVSIPCKCIHCLLHYMFKCIFPFKGLWLPTPSFFFVFLFSYCFIRVTIFIKLVSSIMSLKMERAHQIFGQFKTKQTTGHIIHQGNANRVEQSRMDHFTIICQGLITYIRSIILPSSIRKSTINRALSTIICNSPTHRM